LITPANWWLFLTGTSKQNPDAYTIRSRKARATAAARERSSRRKVTKFNVIDAAAVFQ
jgi:hypothetical protein